MVEKQPIRILCVFSTLDRGGAESMCMNLYRNMDRDKVQFDFVKHTHSKGAFEDEIIDLGGRIFEAPRFYEYNIISYKKWWINHFKNHPEHRIVHGHYFGIASVYLKYAKEFGRITICHSHCTRSNKDSFINNVKRIIKDYHLKSIEKVSDYSFACSKDAGEWIFRNKSYQVINNAINTELFKYNLHVRDKARKELGLQNKLVIGVVGRIMLQKNPLGIVDIFAEICKKKNNSMLLWVGTYDTDMGKKAMQRAKEKGIIDKIIFTGVVDNVHEIIQAMDCFILPSFFEGLGIVAIEAQTAGLTCFISDVVPREVEVTDLCTFLPLDDYSKWADAILQYNYSDRKSHHIQVADAGYDVSTTAKWLQDFYLNIQGE